MQYTYIVNKDKIYIGTSCKSDEKNLPKTSTCFKTSYFFRQCTYYVYIIILWMWQNYYEQEPWKKRSLIAIFCLNIDPVIKLCQSLPNIKKNIGLINKFSVNY
jgi:hypothetical protein